MLTSPLVKRALLGLGLGVMVASNVGCYRYSTVVVEEDGEEVVVEEDYEPVYYDDYVVYYDANYQPYYYVNGSVYYVPRTDARYRVYVDHYNRYGTRYQRWSSRQPVRRVEHRDHVIRKPVRVKRPRHHRR